MRRRTARQESLAQERRIAAAAWNDDGSDGEGGGASEGVASTPGSRGYRHQNTRGHQVTDEMIGTMGAEEALAAAAAEGLTLWRSNNVSGYRAVYHQKNVNAANGGIFEVRTKEGDNMISHHGYFRTAEHAALVFARYVRDERGEAGETRLSEGLGGLPQPEMMMGADEALAAAEAEGLVLERTDARADGSGFNRRAQADARAWERNGIPAGIVRVRGDRYSRPFEASLQFNAKTTHLAWCATAEQAALLRARALRDAKAALAAERAAAAAAAGEDEEEKEGMLTAEEALAKAEAEGLAFARSEKAKSGYKNVYIIDTSSYSNKNAPYHVAFNGKNLGFYETPRARRPRRRALRGRRRVPPRSARPARPGPRRRAPRRRPQHDAAQAAEGPRGGGVGAGVGVGVGGGLGEAEARAEQGAVDVEHGAAARRRRRRDERGGGGRGGAGGARGHPDARRERAAAQRVRAAAPRQHPLERAAAHRDARRGGARGGGGGGRGGRRGRGGGGGGCRLEAVSLNE